MTTASNMRNPRLRLRKLTCRLDRLGRELIQLNRIAV
jgi:hypothetical protein